MNNIAFALVLAVTMPAAAEQTPGWLGVGLTRHADASQHWLHVRVVNEGGPAARAGLRPDDIVTAWDGKAFRFRDDLEFLERVGGIASGQRVVFTIRREQKTIRITMTAVPMSAEKRKLWERYLAAAREQRRAAQ
jgi:S1-C subfamily serine protease